MSEVRILFQNEDFLAVDKDAGISVHNNEDPQNLLSVLQNQLKVEKLWPVHRLDKETSGVQVLSKSSTAARDLADEFQKKSVKKIYHGLLRGELKSKGGLWNLSLTDKAEGRSHPAGFAKARLMCETQFKVLQASKFFTLCEFNLLTGRQHQIRKHAVLAHHALVGDARYGEAGYNKKIASLYKTDRMFLHCHRLELAGVQIESPVPRIFESVFKPV